MWNLIQALSLSLSFSFFSLLSLSFPFSPSAPPPLLLLFFLFDIIIKREFDPGGRIPGSCSHKKDSKWVKEKNENKKKRRSRRSRLSLSSLSLYLVSSSLLPLFRRPNSHMKWCVRFFSLFSLFIFSYEEEEKECSGKEKSVIPLCLLSLLSEEALLGRDGLGLLRGLLVLLVEKEADDGGGGGDDGRADDLEALVVVGLEEGEERKRGREVREFSW